MKFNGNAMKTFTLYDCQTCKKTELRTPFLLLKKKITQNSTDTNRFFDCFNKVRHSVRNTRAWKIFTTHEGSNGKNHYQKMKNFLIFIQPKWKIRWHFFWWAIFSWKFNVSVFIEFMISVHFFPHHFLFGLTNKVRKNPVSRTFRTYDEGKIASSTVLIRALKIASHSVKRTHVR